MRAYKWWMALFIAVGVAFYVGRNWAQGEGKTLRQLLTAEHVPFAADSLSNLDKVITSGAELNDAQQFAIAYYVSDSPEQLNPPIYIDLYDRRAERCSYYVSDSPEQLNPPIYIDLYDRRAERWKSGAIEAATAKSAGVDVDCLGSVLEVTAFANYLALETHINPSAGCEIILSRDLKLKTSLYGWSVGRFGDGGIVYHRSQVHFATVHPAEIAVYDPETGRDYTVFPHKPFQEIRLRLTEELREFFKTHQDYCKQANDPCDAELFDSSLTGKVVTDDREHAVAFVISYELQGFRSEERRVGKECRSGWWPDH